MTSQSIRVLTWNVERKKPTWPIGPDRIVCVCIPWHMSNVQYGARNRRPWQDHIRYVELLPAVLASCDEPLIVAGGYTQRIPWIAYGNRAAAVAMNTAFETLDVITAGAVESVHDLS